MIRVANHLVAHALSTPDPEEMNLFGRSAFNRYYYSTFLVIRKTLAQIDSRWAEPNHSGVPSLLRDTVFKKIKAQINKQLMNPLEGMRLTMQARNATSIMANLMDEAYYLRIVADYQPDKLVTRENSKIELNAIKNSKAATWPQTATRESGHLLHVAKKVGLI